MGFNGSAASLSLHPRLFSLMHVVTLNESNQRSVYFFAKQTLHHWKLNISTPPSLWWTNVHRNAVHSVHVTSTAHVSVLGAGPLPDTLPEASNILPISGSLLKVDGLRTEDVICHTVCEAPLGKYFDLRYRDRYLKPN